MKPSSFTTLYLCICTAIAWLAMLLMVVISSGAQATEPVPGCWDHRFSPLCLDGLEPGKGIGDVGENPIDIPIELPDEPDRPPPPYIPPPTSYEAPEPSTLALLLLGFVAAWPARSRR